MMQTRLFSLFSAVSLVFLSLACEPSVESLLDGKTAVVEGKLSGITGSGSLRVSRIGANGPVTVDSADWDAEGAFRLVMPGDTENLYLLELGKDRVALFIEPGLHVFSTDVKSVANFSYSGSPLTDQLRKLELIRRNFEREAQVLERLHQQASQSQNEKGIDSISNRFAELQNQSKRELKQYLVSIGPGPVAYLATAMLPVEDEFDFLDSLAGVFEKKRPGVSYTRKFSRFLEKPRLLAVGKEAPDFTVTDPAGKPVSLSRFRGKWVLLDFWASWCGPCRAENPNLVGAFNRYAPKGFTIFSVSLDGDREAWMKAMVTDRMFWAHGSELKGWKSEVARQYGITSIPQSYLLDPDGKIVAKNLRGRALEQMLAKQFR